MPGQGSRFPVGGDGGNDMADPAQKTTRSDPQAGGDDQPENSPPEMAVIKLPHTGNQEAQHCGIASTCHVKSFCSELGGIDFDTLSEISKIIVNLSELFILIKMF